MTSVVQMLTPDRVANILSRLLSKAEPPEAFSRPELTQAYNLAVTQLDRPDNKVKSFKDTKTAVKRVTNVLIELAGKPAAKKAEAPAKAEATKPVTNGAGLAPGLRFNPGQPGEKPEQTQGTVKQVDIKALPAVTTKRAGSKRLDGDKVIKVVAVNPHKKGTKDYDSFAKLKDGMTVAKAREAAADPSYLSYAVKRGLVKLN